MSARRNCIMKKWISAALALLLTASVLCACMRTSDQLQDETAGGADMVSRISSELVPLSTEAPAVAPTEGKTDGNAPATTDGQTTAPAETTSAKQEETTSEKATEKPTEKDTEAPTEAPTQAPAAPASSGVTSKGYSIEVINGITYVGGVMIANKTYSLPSSYYPGGLTGDCSAAFSRMQSAAAGEGLNLFVLSGFRSYDTQAGLYDRYCARDGKAAADRYSARPGHSEHQTGLAIDVNSVSSDFEYTAEGQWLAANCYKYGFILRYMKGKEWATGYMYEPWHIRYVGEDLAAKVYNSGLCLEEYFGITSSYS